MLELAQHFYMGHHRVPVVDSQRKIVNLVTQSDLLAFLARHSFLLGFVNLVFLTISCNVYIYIYICIYFNC